MYPLYFGLWGTPLKFSIKKCIFCTASNVFMKNVILGYLLLHLSQTCLNFFFHFNFIRKLPNDFLKSRKLPCLILRSTSHVMFSEIHNLQ
uniref:Uncharacterized protein n=1 Tax=Arundo donax TaxID=35708 RepID=A0A0A8Z2D7_ARUDO